MPDPTWTHLLALGLDKLLNHSNLQVLPVWLTGKSCVVVRFKCDVLYKVLRILL